MNPPPYNQMQEGQPQLVVASQPYYQAAPQAVVYQQQPPMMVVQQQQPMYVPVVMQAQQPQASPVNNTQQVVVVHANSKDPMALGADAAAQILRGGLCSCFDDLPTCLCSCLFPMCQNGLTAASVEIGNCLWCCLCYGFFPCCTGAIVRAKLHERAGLQDPGFISNCCLHMCCMCCALAQEGRAAAKLKAANVLMSR